MGAALKESRIWTIRSEKWNKGEGVQLNKREEVQYRRKGREEGKITLRMFDKTSKNHTIFYIPKISGFYP